MFKRIGELLVECGELKPDDLARILAAQQHAYQPFGRIAAQLFGVRESAIWSAWAQQYARFCPRIDLAGERSSREVLVNLTPASAWNCRLLPLRWHDGDLVMVTCPPRLARALQFVDARIEVPTVIWLTHSAHALEDALLAAYPGCDRLESFAQDPTTVDAA